MIMLAPLQIETKHASLSVLASLESRENTHADGNMLWHDCHVTKYNPDVVCVMHIMAWHGMHTCVADHACALALGSHTIHLITHSIVLQQQSCVGNFGRGGWSHLPAFCSSCPRLQAAGTGPTHAAQQAGAASPINHHVLGTAVASCSRPTHLTSELLRACICAQHQQ